ncbi:MAG TPA: bifunctional (p)ppGpp synthetase/guanosine-3',5'-bis(diphosphate) 3'-pyrophosphohydrolase [Candidatus Micrarchaeia archaeon]|nr:bifunctional (p)ppGpp synthetase/guanosine-3',5'-bis(diphosphate) 3'-pyrophosphohydrolase [Candidatus Micrarchaeia archaeon]
MDAGPLATRLTYLAPAERERVGRAHALAARAHQGQLRLSGDPYLVHPEAVAATLADLHLDADALAAALLHDVLEDTEVTAETLREQFGPTVEKLVQGVTKLGRIHARPEGQAQAENIRKMLIAMAEDLRVVLIKLGDRLHNMRTISPLAPDRRQRIAQETLDIYAPLAHRLGMWQMKAELEDLALAVLDPAGFEAVTGAIASRRKELEQVLGQAGTELERELTVAGIRADINGRPKHAASVLRKMQQHGKSLEEIYDLVAIRIVCEDVRSCYGVLGVVHTLWKPIPGRFKDYVAMPKGNGYQSLHTTVVGAGGEPMEIQIRTAAMHRTAEEGIAAHWHYKESSAGDPRLDERFSWLRALLEWQKEMLDAERFVENVKLDIFPDEVFVFTPKGEVRSLPAGSTPVDFAYRIHTDVGHRCLGAKVNSRMVPLDHRLENGDIVEVLTTRSERHGPSRDWLNFVKTSSARDKIRQWFKRQRREENVARGRELLERELRRLRGQSLSQVPVERLADTARELRYQELPDFLAAIGYGELSPRTVVLRWAARDDGDGETGPVPRLTIPIVSRPAGQDAVRVRGVDNVLATLAQCCKPVPGEAIRGYVTRGRGVSVHRASCSNLRHGHEPERLVEVEWIEAARQVFPVALKIEGWDRTGLLRDVATVIAESRVNLSGAAVEVTDDHTAVISTVVEIASLTQLSRLLEKLEAIRDVHTVARETG